MHSSERQPHTAPPDHEHPPHNGIQQELAPEPHTHAPHDHDQHHEHGDHEHGDHEHGGP